MDFRQQNQAGSARPAPNASANEDSKTGSNNKRNTKLTRILSVVFLVAVVVIVIGVILAFASSSGTNESKYVKKNQYQAVFLNNGQVYFGHIDKLSSNYISLKNIYYLTQSGDSTSSNYSLVKLGCQQIHNPEDQMLINRDQVTFWENLNDNGKVVSSIADFKKQYPNGPDCSQVSNQTQADSNATTQDASNGVNTNTNGSTNDSTGNKQ